MSDRMVQSDWRSIYGAVVHHFGEDSSLAEKVAQRLRENAPPTAKVGEQLLYRETITVKHSDYHYGEPPLRWIIEWCVGVGSVPSVTGCDHETVIEFEIPCDSLWQAYEMAQEADVTLAGYGVHVTKIDESKIVTAPWRNTCDEAMRLMYERAS